MPRLRDLYLLEMARSRGDDTWAVLDWAAQQEEPFTVKDLYKVYQDAGGGRGYTSFSTTIGRLTAHPRNREGEQEVSERQPFEIVRHGSRGAGGAAQLRWGLDHPLREPPTQSEPGEGDDEGTAAVGDALDRLENIMGRDKLKAAMARWKNLPPHRLTADIQASVPRRGQTDAFHVAMDYLHNSRGSTPPEPEPAPEPEEPEAPAAPIPAAPGHASQRPAAAPTADDPVGRNPGFDEPDDEEEPEPEDEPEPMAPPPPPPTAPKKSPVGKLMNLYKGKRPPQPQGEGLGMNTGLTEPVDFSHRDGQNRVSNMTRRRPH